MLRVLELGQVDFSTAYDLQEQLVSERADETIPDTLLLLQHPPTITLGRRGSWTDIHVPPTALAMAGIEVHETNRGGLVTYHGPGQVVGYIIARLATFAGTAPNLVQGLEEGIIRTLAELGITAFRRTDHRGVFTAEGKIAAIGVGVRRGITMHGFAFNLCPDLRHFAIINPCGLEDLGVTSVERLLGARADPQTTHQALAFHLREIFPS
ncbi:MAG: lipoyl(octanoyl) transferase LipB [Chloroflexota bacterium]